MAGYLSIYLTGLAILLALMSVLWIVSVLLTNASIVDPFWGLSFVIIVWFYFARTPGGDAIRKSLLVVLVTLWGLRLALYLLWRNWGHGEDFRYQAFRRKYGTDRYWWISFVQTFMLQGVLVWIISSTLFGAQVRGGGLNILDYLGIVIWIVGIIFEAGSDFQLAQFKGDPANQGKLLQTGFRRYTRHPNYFGDAACWWGFGLMSIAAGSYLAALGAVVMTVLIIRVSGVALLEKSLNRDKPGYDAFARRTSAFIPLPPKK
jgi:steroid 5-alpha reductase family enzyme